MKMGRASVTDISICKGNGTEGHW